MSKMLYVLVLSPYTLSGPSCLVPVAGVCAPGGVAPRPHHLGAPAQGGAVDPVPPEGARHPLLLTAPGSQPWLVEAVLA